MITHISMTILKNPETCQYNIQYTLAWMLLSFVSSCETAERTSITLSGSVSKLASRMLINQPHISRVNSPLFPAGGAGPTPIWFFGDNGSPPADEAILLLPSSSAEAEYGVPKGVELPVLLLIVPTEDDTDEAAS